MAVAGFNPTAFNLASFNAMLQADAVYLQSVYAYLKRKQPEYQQYKNSYEASLNLVAADVNTTGIWLQNLNKLIRCFEGTLVAGDAAGENIVNDVANLAGLG